MFDLAEDPCINFVVKINLNYFYDLIRSGNILIIEADLCRVLK